MELLGQGTPAQAAWQQKSAAEHLVTQFAVGEIDSEMVEVALPVGEEIWGLAEARVATPRKARMVRIFMVLKFVVCEEMDRGMLGAVQLVRSGRQHQGCP